MCSWATRIPINQKLERLTPLIDAYRAAAWTVTLKVFRAGGNELLNEPTCSEVSAGRLLAVACRALAARG